MYPNREISRLVLGAILLSAFAPGPQIVAVMGEPVDLEPWEPGDVGIGLPPSFEKPGLLASAELRLIAIYQDKVGPRSIDRCPFYLSCSHYAEQAILRKGGVLGLLYVIDRYFFRENKSASRHYPWHVLNDGRIKIDDSWYLEVGQ